ncbi:MAG: hypothetical protein R3F30_09210 [Planctomycetota bacterium]
MSERWDLVHTVTDYYDGPRAGVADLDGAPHCYRSEWNQEQEEGDEVFLLMPIDEETLALATEDQEIWRRWQDAFRNGFTGLSTHPALPEDRERHEELVALLAGRLNIDPCRAVRKLGTFRTRDDAEPGPAGTIRDLEVRWSDHG